MKEREITGVEPIDKIRSLFAHPRLLRSLSRYRMRPRSLAYFPSFPIFSSSCSLPEHSSSVKRNNASFNSDLTSILHRLDRITTGAAGENLSYIMVQHTYFSRLSFSSFPSRELTASRPVIFFSPLYMAAVPVRCFNRCRQSSDFPLSVSPATVGSRM